MSRALEIAKQGLQEVSDRVDVILWAKTDKRFNGGAYEIRPLKPGKNHVLTLAQWSKDLLAEIDEAEGDNG